MTTTYAVKDNAQGRLLGIFSHFLSAYNVMNAVSSDLEESIFTVYFWDGTRLSKKRYYKFAGGEFGGLEEIIPDAPSDIDYYHL